MSTGGLSRARLDRMYDIMAGHVERGEVPGTVTLVSRRGKVPVHAIGMKAVEGALRTEVKESLSETSSFIWITKSGRPTASERRENN